MAGPIIFNRIASRQQYQKLSLLLHQTSHFSASQPRPQNTIVGRLGFRQKRFLRSGKRSPGQHAGFTLKQTSVKTILLQLPRG